MITILQHLIPIALGFFAKLVAIKSQQAHDQNKIMFAVLALVAIYPLAGVFGIDTVIEVVEKPATFFFGLFEIGGGTRFETVKGLYKFDEIFAWATMIIEFYFGGQLAKGK